MNARSEQAGALKEPPRRIFGVAALAALLLLLDVARRGSADFHPHFAAERWFGFFVLASCGGCLMLSILAVGLSRWLGRDEDYYGE